jgi:cytidylate kinase
MSPEIRYNEREPVKANFACLTISGLSGTGKTEAGILLAERLGIPDEQFIRTGLLFRAAREKITGESVIGYQDRSLDIDREIDLQQREVIISATIQKPVILEGKLAGIIKQEVEKERQDLENTPPLISFLFYTPEDVRMERVVSREHKKHPEKTRKEIIQSTLKRDEGDIGQWQKAHPSLANIDPFNPENSQHVYDLVIDTTASIEEVVEKVLVYLKQKKLAISQ